MGAKKEVARVVEQLRPSWPNVQIILRGDSGFCVDELMAWCEDHRVDYVLGLARNKRLEALVVEALGQAKQQWEAT